MKLRKWNNKAIGTAAAALIAIIFLGLVGGVMFFGYETNWKFQAGTTQGGNNPPPTGNAVGTFEIGVTLFNSLSPTTSTTVMTDVLIYYYRLSGGLWTKLGQASAVAGTAVPITLVAGDNGYIYAVCTTSSSYFVDAPATAAQNGISYVGYENVVGGTTLPQWVFRLNLNGVVPSNRAVADFTYNIYDIADNSASFAMGTAPSNQTSAGTALNTTYCTWYAKTSTTGVGVAVRQITISVNDSDSSQSSIYKQNIPGVGFISGGVLTVQPQASAVVYTWNAPTDSMTGAIDLGSCIYWSVTSGQLNKFDLTTAIQSTFSASKETKYTMTVYLLDPVGGSHSVTQQWELNE